MFASSGFNVKAVYNYRRPSVFHAAKERLSFIIASFSIFAFVIGNMVGQHGWYAFWKTVLGKEDYAVIAFVGTVPPIDKIPNYTEWARYGGNKAQHTFKQVPEQVLYPLPFYDQASLSNNSASTFARQVYSTLWAGAYNGPSGSHAGVDIDAPRGTPIQAIANGVVEKMNMGKVGFGHYVMIRHPNVPDSSAVGGKTTLRSTYAHMDNVLVAVGEYVHKGQVIGTVGNTGFVIGATGYHLYFEVDREHAPYHPYWPFTSTEASQAGLSFVQAVNSTRYQSRVFEYTINPMAFVQQYQTYTPLMPSVALSSTNSHAAPSLAPAFSLKDQVSVRRMSRLAKTGVSQPRVFATVATVSNLDVLSPLLAQTVTEVKTASVETVPHIPVIRGSNTDIDHLSIQTSGKLSRTWQKVRISALDAQGNLVAAPSFQGRLYLMAEFGEAEIRPKELSPLDFTNGVATVNVLTRTQSKPVIIQTKGQGSSNSALNAASAPMLPSR